MMSIRTPLPLTFAFALALGAAGTARAQTPAVAAELAAFRDSVSAITDSAAAAGLESALRRDAERAAQGGPAPVAHLRHGLAALRHAELGNRHRFGRARDAFGRAAELEPSWAWPVYAAALAHAAEFEAQRADSLEIGKRIGVGHLNAAVGALVTALERDSAFTPALLELERLAWRLHETENWETALEVFRGVRGPAAQEPAVLLARARFEREIGSADSALALLARYRALGGSPGLAHLETARTRFQRELPGGAADYFAGAAYDDSLAVAGYRADLLLIVPDSTLAELDAARGAERAAVLRRFWADRARIELRAPEERLREHYRRLHYARRHFALSITRRHQPMGCPYRSGSMEFDDRGIVYIRHGEPTERLTPSLFTLMPNESWRYARADGDLLLHFGAGVDVHDYRLVQSVAHLTGGCTTAGTSVGSISMPDLWLSRQTLDPMYAKLSAWSGSAAGSRLAAEEQAIGAASIEVGTTTDSHELRFERPLDAVLDVVAVGARGDRTIAHVVFGIRGPAASAEGLPADTAGAPAGVREYPVRIRAVAYGSDRRVAGYLDSTATYRMPVPLDSTRHLFGRMELPLPEGTWTVRAAVELAGAGTVLPSDSVRVASSAPGGELRLSGLALGWREIGLAWPRAADTVYFSPFRSYFGDAELELYYEVHGLETGTEYGTRLEIVPREGGGLLRRRAPGVRLGFRDVARGTTASARRTVSLADLRPGGYWLDVIVTDAAGRTARRRIGFDVEARR